MSLGGWDDDDWFRMRPVEGTTLCGPLTAHREPAMNGDCVMFVHSHRGGCMFMSWSLGWLAPRLLLFEAEGQHVEGMGCRQIGRAHV